MMSYSGMLMAVVVVILCLIPSDVSGDVAVHPRFVGNAHEVGYVFGLARFSLYRHRCRPHTHVAILVDKGFEIN